MMVICDKAAKFRHCVDCAHSVPHEKNHEYDSMPTCTIDAATGKDVPVKCDEQPSRLAK